MPVKSYFFGVVLLRNAKIGNPLATKPVLINFVLLGAVLMLLTWVVTVVTQLAKKLKENKFKPCIPYLAKRTSALPWKNTRQSRSRSCPF